MKNHSIPRQARDGEQTCLACPAKPCRLGRSGERPVVSKVKPCRKSRTILVLAIMVLWIPVAAEAKYSGGTGEPNDPYRIATPEDLNDIGNHLEDFNKHFILVNDVNLAQYTGRQFRIIWSFAGVFDGNDHKIWNFTWHSTPRGYTGLFGCVVRNGQIKNLGMENVDVNDVKGDLVGGLVGFNYKGTITNCYSTGSVSGLFQIGGLVGGNYGTITNCYSTGSVTGNTDVGGLVGFNEDTISDCYSSGSVSGSSYVGGLVGHNHKYYYSYCEITNCYSSGSVSGSSYVGGLVGLNEDTISACYSTGSVTGNSNVGVLVGRNNGTITNCYSTGSVTGTDYVGGLVGTNYAGTISVCYSTGNVTGTKQFVGGLVGNNQRPITNCYSTGSVSGDEYVGGLVGSNYNGRITNCYSTGSVSGNLTVGGLVGLGMKGFVRASFWDTQTSGQLTSGYGTGKTTAEMKTMDTFIETGWDFVEIWGIGENQTYPFLLTDPAGDSNHDKKVDFADLAILASHWLEGPP